MARLMSLLIAAPLAAGLLAAPSAHAEWRHHGGYERHWEHHGRGPGPVIGALVGLGAAAVVGGLIASQPYYAAPPPYAYAPPPPYGYAPPPAYYYAPPPPPAW